MAKFDSGLFRKFWMDLSRRPGFSETDLLMKDGGRKYGPIFRARNHNLACEAADGNCDRCPLPGQRNGQRCMTVGDSSLYVRWHTATQIAKAAREPDFEQARAEAVVRAMEKFGFTDQSLERQDDPRLFLGLDALEASALARGMAREISRLPDGGDKRRKMKKLDFLQLIWSFPPGKTFSAADFRIFGSTALVGWHLCALSQSGVIRRVGHGKYVHDGVCAEFVPLRQKILDAMRAAVVKANDAGMTFTRNDFFTFAGIEAISQQLSRLTRSGDIIREERGRYKLAEKNRPFISDRPRDTDAACFPPVFQAPTPEQPGQAEGFQEH